MYPSKRSQKWEIKEPEGLNLLPPVQWVVLSGTRTDSKGSMALHNRNRKSVTGGLSATLVPRGINKHNKATEAIWAKNQGFGDPWHTVKDHERSWKYMPVQDDSDQNALDLGVFRASTCLNHNRLVTGSDLHMKYTVLGFKGEKFPRS